MATLNPASLISGRDSNPAPSKGRFADSARSFLVQGALLVTNIALLFGLYAVTVQAVFIRYKGNAYVAAFIGGSAVAVCALPALLSFLFARLLNSSRSSRSELGATEQIFVVDANSQGQSRLDSDRRAVDQVRAIWHYERAQIERVNARFSQHAAFYGFFCSATLAVCTTIISEPLFAGALESGQPYRVRISVAVLSGAALSFIRELGRMLVRAANRDSSAQMLAIASKRILIVVASTVVLSCLLIAGEFHLVSNGSVTWILIGAAIAALGDQAANTIDERVARFVGVAIPDQGRADDLRQIDGLTREDATRLAEEGIDSVHALALYSTPKLFFNSPYPLPRVCDWQDQALLITRLGIGRMRIFRDQMMVHGSIDAQRLARNYLSAGLPAVPGAAPAPHLAVPTSDHGSDMIKLLGFSSLEQAGIVFQRLAQDDVAERLAVYQRAIPAVERVGA